MPDACTIPKPQPGEIQVDYYQRVFPTLDGSTEDRNEAILDEWDQSEQATALDAVASRKFPAEKFSRLHRVPVFTEHETARKSVAPDGTVTETPFVWDRDRLAAMAYAMNERILDTGSFAPLTEGHTPDRHAKAAGCPAPAVLGYAGKFRLGMIGNRSPRWAIFQDEYHHAAEQEKLARMTRRSPEVWPNAAQPFFDPVAVLGAETPRLDMGTAMTYSRSGYWEAGTDGADVERYSMATAAFPSAANVGGQQMVKPREDYAAEDGQADDGLVEQIIQAVSQMPEIQMLQQLAPLLPRLQELALKAELPETDDGMQGDGSEVAPDQGDTASSPATSAPEMSQQAAQPTAPTPPPAPPAPAPATPANDDTDRMMMSKYMAGQCDEPALRSYRDSKKGQAAPVAPAASPEMAAKYSRLEQENARLKADARANERYSRLESLRKEGYAFDLADEVGLTAAMSDEQFSTHCSRVVTKYSRLSTDDHLFPVFEGDPAPTSNRKAEEVERYQMEDAVKLVDKSRRGGKEMTFAEALTAVKTAGRSAAMVQ